jgi:hypothetical protein
MAPTRPLYGDLSSAYTSIARRTDSDSNMNNPSPPAPVAQTPGSSQHTSPVQTTDSKPALSPLALDKTGKESRFSLRQLTRNLPWPRGNNQENNSGKEPKNGHELKEFSPSADTSRVSPVSASFNGEFPRPLDQSYQMVATESPLDYAVNIMSQRNSNVPSEHSRFYTHRYSSAPLTSLIPDDPSTQLGRASDPRPSTSDGDMYSKPYYDDLVSIYPSSSVYTGDDQAHSQYAPSIVSDKKSNPYARLSVGADALANEYKSDAVFDYPDSRRNSRRVSRPLTHEMFRRSMQRQMNDQTDTISKFIDGYKLVDDTSSSQPVLHREDSLGDARLPLSSSGAFANPYTAEQPVVPRVGSGFSQFKFGIRNSPEVAYSCDVGSLPFNDRIDGRLSTDYTSGAPPPMAAPLAPAFEYDEVDPALQRPEPSEMFSGVSSYGDTRQLLQLSQPTIPGHDLEPSSSYSQPETLSNPETLQEALELADQIFEVAAPGQQEEAIPVMWTRRNSGNLLRSKTHVDNTALDQQEERDSYVAGADDEAAEADDDDWETVGDRSQPERSSGRLSAQFIGNLSGRLSLSGSIADYSSSADSDRDSLGFSHHDMPAYGGEMREDDPLEPGSFQFHYQHPSPLRGHSNPFNSSPPQLMACARVRSTPNDDPPSSPIDNLQASLTVPAWKTRHDSTEHRTSSFQPSYTNPLWMNPLGLSDKETQELLTSGPNEDILYEDGYNAQQEMDYPGTGSELSLSRSDRAEPPTTSSLAVTYGVERENTFDKVTVVGPKGNLTGTPRGTGMNDAGSSMADNSSPGAFLSSSPPNASASDKSKRIHRVDFAKLRAVPSRTPSFRPGIPSFVSPMRGSSESAESPGNSDFYVSPGKNASMTRVIRGLNLPKTPEDRTPSQATLFPQPTPEGLPQSEPSRHSRNILRTPRRARHNSRAAVPGQTKLRNMVLAPDAQSFSSTSDISRIIRTADSERPSTSNTHTPLRTHQSQSTLRTVVAYEHSPHLLCPERSVDLEEEEERRKLSWCIFALFCLLPPMLLLYRWFSDFCIVSLTKGRLGHVAPKPKRIALGVGIAVNLGLSTVILLPILIARGAGAL